MRINIVGWYGEKNAGDEAFRLVFQTYLKDHELNFTQSINANSDLSILGGGGVMQETYLKGFVPEHPTVALGVDVALNGPRYDAVRALNLPTLYLRSREYASIAQDQGWEVAKYCPDLAFGIDRPFTIDDSQVLDDLATSRQPKLGIILTDEIMPFQNRMAELKKSLKVLQQHYDLFFISMYHGEGNPDAPVNRIAAEGLDPSRCFFVEHTHDPMTILGTIARMDKVISMRFHGVIFSAVAGVPFISIANTGKHSLFCEQEQLKDYWINLQELTSYRLLSIIQGLDQDSTRKWNLDRQLLRISTVNRITIRSLFNLIKEKYLSPVGSKL